MTYTAGSSGYSGDFNSNAQGSARWATPDEATELELDTYKPGSIILGQTSQGRLTFLNRQGHVLCLAPPRSGKGIGIVQGNLAAYSGSIVCTDPKGENAAVAHAFRRDRMGHNVVILDPTEKLKSYALPEAIPTHAFNPLAVLSSPNYAEVLDDVGMLADALLVPQAGEKEQHWRDGARQVIEGLLVYQAFFLPVADRNLIMLSRLANGLEAKHDDIFTALTHNDHPDPIMQDVISKHGGWFDKINDRERASFVSFAIRSLAWLNSPVWYNHLRDSDFHPYDLKAGKTSVFIVCPFEKLEQYSPWFRIVLSSCIIAVLRGPKRCDVSTLFELDEYAACIGRLATLEHSIPYMEGMGGRYMMIFQYLSQMTKLWPGDEFNGIFASAGAHVFFNVSDKFTSEYVSTYIGKYSAMSPGPGGMSFISRDLLTPDEVRTMPHTDMLAFIRGYRPAWLGKLNVLEHPEFHGRLLPNPTYLVQSGQPNKVFDESKAVLLSATDALQRANKKSKLSLKSITAALEEKYPGQEFELEGDMIGYRKPFTDPVTGQTEMIHMPVMHVSLMEALAKGGNLSHGA